MLSHKMTTMDLLRKSAVPYLSVLIASVMLGGYGNYLAPLAIDGGISIKGQSLGIFLPILLFPVAFVCWLIYDGHRTTSHWLQWFLGGLIGAWFVHFALTRFHGDMYVHTVWLFVPVILMIFLKTPSYDEAWNALIVLAWFALAFLVLTRTLELLGVIPQWFYPTPGEALWEREHYWLPFAGHFDVASRWPGPFGFNSKTGFVSVTICVIALARWRRIASPMLIVVGVIGILLTGGRGVYLSLAAGVMVLLLFSRWRLLNRIPVSARLVVLAVAVCFLGYRFASSATATTGRIGDNGIWGSFLDLWRSSPLTGVGLSGIWDAPGRAGEAMDAHSIFIQELAQFGLIGLVTQFTVIAFGLFICLMSAARQWAGPLAIVTVYLVAGATDLLHSSWQLHSLHTLLIILATTSAASWLNHQGNRSNGRLPLHRTNI